MPDWPEVTAGAGTAISGIAASNTTYTSGTVSLTGVGGGVTVSSNTGQRVDISVAAPVAQTAQTGISSIAASNTTYTSGSVQFSGSNAATVKSSANQRVIIDVPLQTAETAISGLAASNTTYTSGTVTISGVGGGITVSSNTGQRIDLSVAAPVAQTAQTGISSIAASNTTYTSGQVEFTGSNAATVKSSANQRVVIDVPTQTAQTQSNIQGIAGSNTTYNTGTVEFTGSNMVTVKSSANQRIVIDATQTVQTQNLVDITLSSNTAGALALISSGTLTLAGGNNITLSQAGNAVTISGAAAGGAQTAISGVAASNTTYTSGTITITGVGGGITVSSNTGQRVDLSVAAQSVQTQGIQAEGVSNLGNTAGSTGVLTGSRVVLVGTNNITLSQSTDAGSNVTISISGAAAGGGGGVNIAASNTTYTSGTVSFTGVGGLVTVSSNTGQRVDISVKEPDLPVWQNFPLDLAATVVNLTGNNKFPMFWGEALPGNVTLNSVGFHLSNFSTGTLQSFTVQFGVYTYVNSTSAALLGSASDQFILSTASSASWSGQRDFVLTSPSTQTAISNLSGGGYLFGANFSVAATGSMAMNLYGAGATTIAPLGRVVPGSNNASTGASQGLRGIFGQLSASSAAMPANVRVADMFANQGTGAAWQPWIYIAS